MLGLLASLIVFNFIAFRFTSRLSLNEKIHIWLFSISLQALFDLFVDAKMGAYWYFTRDIDWASLPIILFLVPPVNLCVLSWYPYGRTIPRQLVYILCVYIFQIVYELLTLMPEPIGYFHYGWWE